MEQRAIVLTRKQPKHKKHFTLNYQNHNMVILKIDKANSMLTLNSDKPLSADRFMDITEEIAANQHY